MYREGYTSLFQSPLQSSVQGLLQEMFNLASRLHFTLSNSSTHLKQ